MVFGSGEAVALHGTGEPPLAVPPVHVEGVPALLHADTPRAPDPPETPNEPQVDVDAGIAEFEKMQREIAESVGLPAPGKAVELSAVEEGQPSIPEAPRVGFDLGSFLEGSVTAHAKVGIQRKRMGVVFKNLTVVGEGADATSIPNLWSPLESFAHFVNPRRWFRRAVNGTDFDILHNLTGFCKDGEMLLVLGRPGAGCSTFLRVIANLRESYKAVSGTVTYGGISATQFEQYLGDTIYTAEEDVHFPTLTVRQTLDVALKCKTPHTRPGISRKNYNEQLMNMLLQMFGLTKQINTPVGNEWIRGLSGGERKRLTIAEAMTARAAVNCWDCTTRGLDAASALDYTKSLRIMSNTLRRTTIASFYQASEDMYNIFDKVLVLDKGVCVYFGPTSSAKQYFEEMGFQCEKRKSTPDFLTGITNPNERKVREGFDGKVPQSAADMERFYLTSPVRAAMEQELKDYEESVQQNHPEKDFTHAFSSSKAKYTRTQSVYVTNFWQQIQALLLREFQLIGGDKGALFGKIFAVLSKSFIYSTTFLLLSTNVFGAFTRGSCLFTSVLFNSLLSLAELPNALRGRRVLQKHKTYAMYHPSAYHIATVISVVQAFLFSICAYFLYGLQYEASKFFIFAFTIFLISLTMTEFFRICGNVTSTYFAASQLANIALVLLLLYSGFLIPHPLMHKWFSWIYWANPMAYAFKGIFSNEMKGLTFDCDNAGGAVPFGPSYANPEYQTCTIPGQIDGTLEVSGPAYLEAHYEYKTSDMNKDIIAVFCFWILYILVNCAAMELLELEAGGYTRQVFKKGKAPKQNDANIVIKQAEVDLDLKGKSAGGKAFTWKDVKYTVPVVEGKRLLLDNVEGWIKPGQMTALMGSSGAGKTTLLDVLAKRKTIGEIEGTILLNGNPLDISFERVTGYVEQMDVHNPSQTVREALRFSARMRQDPSIPIEEKYEYVEKVLAMMEMTHLGDALIGELEIGLGISVEERKRLTIGMELVGKPEILFLDEPTSGLDAQSSYNIVKFIRKLADSGMPLVCTIHQPSSILFEYFDRLLLLARGGKTVYFGDIGHNSQTLIDYFQRNGGPHCDDSENPAEYILRAIGAGVSSQVTQDWPATWKSSPEAHAVHEELARIQNEGKASAVQLAAPREFATSQGYQFVEVYTRMNLVWWRNPTYVYGRMANAIIISLINGFTYYKLSHSNSDLQSRVFTVFSVLIMGNSLITLAQPMFIRQRQYFRREYASKFYGWWQFALSIILVEVPYLIVAAGTYVLLSYWTSRLQSNGIDGFYFFIMFCSFMIFSVSFGQVIASFCATLVQASVLNPFFTPLLILFAGVLVPPHDMPGFWRSWMYKIDPYHYFLEGVVTDVLNYVNVQCKENELFTFQLDPAYPNCGNYTADFFETAPGYITDPSSTTSCSYCQYQTGVQFFEQFDWSYDHRWRNYGFLWAYILFNITLTIAFVYIFRKPKR